MSDKNDLTIGSRHFHESHDYMAGLDMLGAGPVVKAARALPRASSSANPLPPGQISAIGQRAIAAGQRLMSRSKGRAASAKIARKTIEVGQKAVAKAQSLLKMKSAVAAPAAAPVAAPSRAAARPAAAPPRAATRPTAAPSRAVARPAARATTRVYGEDILSEQASAEVLANFASKWTDLSNAVTGMNATFDALDKLSKDAASAGNNDAAKQAADTSATGKQLIDTYTNLFFGPEFEGAVVQFKAQVDDWTKQASAISPSAADAAPADAGGGGGGGGGEGEDQGAPADGGEGGDAGADGGDAGAAFDDAAEDDGSVSESEALARFRDSGGEYDPFADETAAADEQDFSDSATASMYDADTSMLEADREAPIVGLDFDLRYVFLPHEAIIDAYKERNAGTPMTNLLTPQQKAPPPVQVSPALLKKLARVKQQQAELARRQAAFQRKQDAAAASEAAPTDKTDEGQP